MKGLLSHPIAKLSPDKWTVICLFLTLYISTIQSFGQTYKINFQDNTVSVSSKYLNDIGEAYGLRTGTDQGSGLYSYGWVNINTGLPIHLTSVARTRSNTGLDGKLNGLVHMDHPNQNYPRGNWEIAVPNGTYQVLVSVGDPTTNKDVEIHRINAEGINIINNFIPNSISNSLGRFTSGTATNIVVNDGRLTLSYSGGGVNTKLNYVEITNLDTEIPTTPALSLNSKTSNSVSLTWTSATDNIGVVAYEVYQNNALIQSLNATSFTVSALSANTSYNFSVQAKDAAGNKSPSSNLLTVTTDLQIPNQTALNWTKLKDGHIKRKEAQSIVVDNKLYVVGGFYKYISPYLQITNTMEVYNPSNNTWTYTSPSLRAVSHASIALDELSNGQKELWLIGGFEGNHPGVAINKVQIYNINTNTWRYGPNLPETMSGHANALLGRKIHVFGGVFADRNTNKNAHYYMDLDNQNLGWQIAAPMPQARNHFAGISFQGKIYALGGQNHHDSNNQDVNYAHVYDSYSNTWKKIADLPITRSHFEHDVYVTDNEKIVVVGGRTATTTQITNVSEYDPILDTWSELGSLYAKREASNIAIINNILYVAFGGLNGITPTIDSYSTNFVRTPSNKLGFQANTIELTMNQNVTLKKHIYLWASNGTPSYTINTDNLPNWLSISNTIGNTLVQSKEIELNFNTSNLTAGVHTYQIIASANGYSNAVIDITLTVNPLSDTQAPSAPVLSLGGVTQNSVSLNWTNSTDNVGVSIYNVYNEGILIGNTSNTNYIVTGLNASTTYKFIVKAKDAANNTSNASNVITTTTSEVAMTYKINFQDNTVSVPSGYLKDIGEAYGVRSASDQGSGLYSYGWVNITTGQPINLTNMARTRSNTGLDTRLNGFIHMNHPTQSNPRGNWEIAVPNGTYQILVSVGDAIVGVASETHRINAEGVNIINNFIPNNVNNSLGRFGNGVANNIVVSDGKLTLTYTGGGVNTKLNYVEITPANSSALMKSSNSTKSLKSETKISNQTIEITKVYPNPLSDEGLIRLDFSEKMETKLNYQILDKLGRILQSDDIENEGKDFILISLKGLSSGIYLMKINGNNIKSKLIKILKN